MKPCNVRSIQDYDRLEEAGLGFNNENISIDSRGVFLTIDPHCRIKINHKSFKRFAEWYLTDQGREGAK